MQSLHPKLFLPAAHAAGATVVACALLLFYLIVYLPLENQMKMDDAEATRLQLGLHGSLDVRREHLQLTRQLEDLKELVENTRRRVPSLSAESEFLTFVTHAAETERVDLQDYSRTGQQMSEHHNEVVVVVQGAGNHASICCFLTELDSFPRAALLTRLDISSTDDPNNYPFTATYTLYHGVTRRQAYAPAAARAR